MSADPTELLRRQLAESMPRALASGNDDARTAFIAQIEGVAAKVAEGQAPGAPWHTLAALLHACAALLRDEPFAREGLLPEDLVLLEEWQRARVDREAQHEVSLADAIGAWATSTEDDAARGGGLVVLLNHCADAAVHVLRDRDREAAHALAELLIPLRAALVRWPHAAHLPPFNAFLGCLQALLRGEDAQLARLRAGLDARLAGVLAQIEGLAGTDHRGPTTEDRPPTTDERPPRTDHRPPRTDHRPPTTDERPPTTDHRRTTTDERRTTPALERGRSPEPGASEGSSPVVENDAALPPALEAALAAGDPGGIERALGALPEEGRAAALIALRRRSEARVAQMSPEEQRALALRLRQEQIARTAVDAAALAEQALRDGDPDAVRRLAIEMGQAATHYAKDELPGSPYDELAAFLRGVAAVLRGTPVPAVPAAYRESVESLRAVAEESR
jgi:hypothetical protein